MIMLPLSLMVADEGKKTGRYSEATTRASGQRSSVEYQRISDTRRQKFKEINERCENSTARRLDGARYVMNEDTNEGRFVVREIMLVWGVLEPELGVWGDSRVYIHDITEQFKDSMRLPRPPLTFGSAMNDSSSRVETLFLCGCWRC